METLNAETAEITNNTDIKKDEKSENSTEESSIRDLRDKNNKDEPCFWCELENKCGKNIGDVTLAELTEYSRGKYVFDFCTNRKASKKMSKRASAITPPSTSPTVDASKAETPGELPPPQDESQPQQAPSEETRVASGEKASPRAARCRHSIALSGGRSVRLTTASRGVSVLHCPAPLGDGTPLVWLLSTLTDLFIAVTFTVTCWILFSKSRIMNV